MLCCLVVVVIGLQIAGCKSAEGDRCQVDDDCEVGLRCNKSKHTCEGEGGGQVDAEVPEMLPVDAAIDTPDAPDAM
jgi:hypothetical protein